MPDEDKKFSGALVLDFRKRWRHVKTIYSQIGATRLVGYLSSHIQHALME